MPIDGLKEITKILTIYNDQLILRITDLDEIIRYAKELRDGRIDVSYVSSMDYLGNEIYDYATFECKSDAAKEWAGNTPGGKHVKKAHYESGYDGSIMIQVPPHLESFVVEQMEEAGLSVRMELA